MDHKMMSHTLDGLAGSQRMLMYMQQ